MSLFSHGTGTKYDETAPPRPTLISFLLRSGRRKKMFATSSRLSSFLVSPCSVCSDLCLRWHKSVRHVRNTSMNLSFSLWLIHTKHFAKKEAFRKGVAIFGQGDMILKSLSAWQLAEGLPISVSCTSRSIHTCGRCNKCGTWTSAKSEP